MLKKSLWLAASLTTISGIAIADTAYVTDDGDTGPYTFRSAVEAANANPDIETIQFDFTSPPTIELESAVVYTGAQELHIQGGGSTLSGGSVPAESGTWNSGLFVAKGCASLTIEDLAFVDSFNNGLAVFLGSDDSECDDEVSIELDNLFVGNSQFFGVLVDGQAQAPTDFNTDDFIHHACSDPHEVDAGVSISVTLIDSEIVHNGLPDGGVDGADDPSRFDISLETGCPQDFDGLRVDQGGDGDIHAELVDSHFDGNLADGVELDERGNGSVEAEVDDSTFNDNGDTVKILCTQEAHDAQAGDDPQCVVGEYVQDLDDGFDIDEEGNGDMIAQVADTEVSGNHDEGLDFDEAGDGSIDVEIKNVTAHENEDEALKASEEDEGDVVAEVKDSSFIDGGDDGTQIEEEGDGNVDVEVKDSIITGNAKAGVNVQEDGDGDINVEVKRSTITDNDTGVKVESDDETGKLEIKHTDLSGNNDEYDTNVDDIEVK